MIYDTFGFALATALALAGCSASGNDPTNAPGGQNVALEATSMGSTTVAISEQDMRAALGPSATQAARDEVIAKLPSTTIDDKGTPRTRYVWEGDMLLSREELNALLRADAPMTQAAGVQPELKVMLDQNGRPAFWPRGKRALTYTVDRGSFPSAGKANFAMQSVRQAARDWEGTCPSCQLTIREVPGGNATFVVRYQSQNAPYIAAAFFPNDPPWRRVLFIAAPFYMMSEDPTGVMRHELGHALGYRHEHIAGIPGCNYEDNRWVPLTQYDAKSVMHYPCGGGGTRMMSLSPTDVAGHRRLYS